MRTAWSHTGQTLPPYAGAATLSGRTGPSSRHRLRTWVIACVGVLGLAVCGLGLVSTYESTLGTRVLLLSVALAVLPLGIVIPTFLWLDRFEAEPTRYLVLAFVWGAVVAAFLASIFNTGALLVARAVTDPQSAVSTVAVTVAPFVEEGLKGLLVLLIWWFARREFDGITDGLVYGGICAAGFAFTENVVYLGRAYAEHGTTLLEATFIIRCVLSPFAHPMFTALTGIGIGVAATSGRRLVRVGAPVLGYLCAAFAHAMFNLAAMVAGRGLLTVYLLVEVPVFVAFVSLIVWARRHEGRLIGQFLRPYAAFGWLAPAEVTMLASMSRRRDARIWARANGGRRALVAMRAFQDAASELALLRRRMYHETADSRAVLEERRLLDTLVREREQFIGQRIA